MSTTNTTVLTTLAMSDDGSYAVDGCHEQWEAINELAKTHGVTLTTDTDNIGETEANWVGGEPEAVAAFAAAVEAMDDNPLDAEFDGVPEAEAEAA